VTQVRGFILYRGLSVLDSAPIVAIATLQTRNAKTGPMVQTWIMREDINPVEAIKTKQDSSVCGSCPLRSNLGGSCYVKAFQAPNKIYNSYKRGNYPTLSDQGVREALAFKKVRVGSYGDPASVPVKVWGNALKLARGYTGYTHQINHKNFDTEILKYCMVSADTLNSATKHHTKNLRTFRVVTDYNQLLPSEIICPADSQGLTCIECGQCNGAKSKGSNIAILVHGSRSKKHVKKYDQVNQIKVVNL